jgi:hypothetical protein
MAAREIGGVLRMSLVHGSYGVGFGKILGGVGEDCSRHTRFEVGDGSMNRFWHDVWCGD